MKLIRWHGKAAREAHPHPCNGMRHTCSGALRRSSRCCLHTPCRCDQPSSGTCGDGARRLKRRNASWRTADAHTHRPFHSQSLHERDTKQTLHQRGKSLGTEVILCSINESNHDPPPFSARAYRAALWQRNPVPGRGAIRCRASPMLARASARPARRSDDPAMRAATAGPKQLNKSLHGHPAETEHARA